MLTLAVVAGIFLFITTAGLVVARLCAWSKPWTADDWIDAPFLGVAVTVVILEGVVRRGGLTLHFTVIPYLAIMAIALGALVVSGRLRGTRRVFPTATFVAALAIYGVHALGLWSAGIRAYTGRAWNDQIDYGLLAQTLIDGTPLPPPPDAAGAWAVARLLDRRVGQSILQGFFASIFHIPVKAAFEPAILLCPFLIVLALIGFGRRAKLPPSTTIVLGMLAGVLPAIATVHLESFFSQAIAIPFVLYTPVVLERAVAGKTVGGYMRPALIVGFAIAAYMEFIPLLAPAVLLFLALAMFAPGYRVATLRGTAVIVLVPWVARLGIGVVEYVRQSSFGAPVLVFLYPWAMSFEGLQRLWAGDFIRNWSVEAFLPRAVSALVFVAGYVGLLELVKTQLRRDLPSHGRQDGYSATACTLAALGFAALPLVMLLRDTDHYYEFYKILMTISPLLAWGAGYGLLKVLTALDFRRAVPIVNVCGVIAAIIPVCGTALMARESAGPVPKDNRQNARTTTDEGFLALERELQRTSDRTIVYCVRVGPNPGYGPGWMAMLGFHNRSWMLIPQVNDGNLLVSMPNYYSLIPGTRLDLTIVTSTERGALWATESLANADVHDFGTFRTVRPGRHAAVVGCSVDLTTVDGRASLALAAAGTPLVVYSNSPAVVALSGQLSSTAHQLSLTQEGMPAASVVPAVFSDQEVALVPGVTKLILASVPPVDGLRVEGLTLQLDEVTRSDHDEAALPTTDQQHR